MDLALSEEQDLLVTSFAALLADGFDAESVREAETSDTPGFDPKLWETLIEMGAVLMAVGEERGGWGASFLDLVLVAEQIGKASAAAPIIETQVAARLLATVATPAALEALSGALEGTSIVTIALHGPVGGKLGLVPAGVVADQIVVLDGERLVLVPVSDANRTVVSNLADAPLADVTIGEEVELVAGPDAVAAFEHALDEWLLLTAAAMHGLATASLAIACEYATERIAFGKLIGTFQGISHPLADDATALDGAQLITRKGAWAIDTDNPRARELAAMAFAFTAKAAEKTTYDAIHTHGGYGFMLEYDMQLHYRRARGWSRVWGDADVAYQRAADARYGKIGQDEGVQG